MGLRRLQTFITKYVPGGVLFADIKKEIDDFKSQNNDAEPLIVIDLLALPPLFYANEHEIILGGRYNLYINRARDLFSRIKELGVRLVFFKEGVKDSGKLTTRLERRVEEYTGAVYGLFPVFRGDDLSEFLTGDLIIERKAFFDDLKELTKKFGEVYTSCRIKCHLEIAEYATRNRALAIISQDMDFLIYEGDWRYWAARELNVDTLCTKEYNRKALRRTLDLESNQMAILATMCGNDYVSYDLVKNFHRSIKSYGDRMHFSAIARKIRSARLAMDSISAAEVRDMARQMFSGVQLQNSGYELIWNSLNSYDYTKLNKDDFGDLPIPFDPDLDQLIFSILTDNSNTVVPLDYFDLSKTDFMSFPDLIMPLIRRMMGILLKNDTKGSKSRKFYFKLTSTTPYEEVIMQPEFPSEDIPPIRSLLYDPVKPGSALDNTRSRLISWLISTDLTTKLMKLPVENLTNVATILHLHELDQIRIDEADCLLLACNCSNSEALKLKLKDMKQIDERDARLAFLFVALRVFISRCFTVVGRKELCSMLTFDGLYFHTLRKKWVSISDEEKQTLLKPYEHLRIYA